MSFLDFQSSSTTCSDQRFQNGAQAHGADRADPKLHSCGCSHTEHNLFPGFSMPENFEPVEQHLGAVSCTYLCSKKGTVWLVLDTICAELTNKKLIQTIIYFHSTGY